VGTALLLENGEIVIGSNQENAAYPSGLCAERVALFNSASNHPKVKIKKIAITARRAKDTHFIDVAPCGSCRQVMLEYEELQDQHIEVLFAVNGRWNKLTSTAVLLPFSFDKTTLK
jgi:cytidine deaminase